MSFLLTHFTPGDESCVQTIRLALAINDEMERRGKKRYRLVVPWFDGERQWRAMLTAFVENERRRPGEILLDERLGRMLSPFFTIEGGYAVAVTIWVSGWQDAGRAVRDHYNKEIVLWNLAGRSVPLEPPNIALELHTAPRFHFGLARAYHVTNCRLSQLFTAMEDPRRGPFALGRELLQSAQKAAAEIERNLCRSYLTVPGTFTSPEMLETAPLDADLVPPIDSPSVDDRNDIPPSSIYVSVSGAQEPGDELKSVLTWGVRVFTNDPDRLGGGIQAPPNVLRNTNIRCHIARGTGEAIAASFLAGTPLLLAPFDRTDDPEIYFNSENAVNWGFARPLECGKARELLEPVDALRPAIGEAAERVRRRFGTVDGRAVAARLIVDDLLREPRPAYE